MAQCGSRAKHRERQDKETPPCIGRDFHFPLQSMTCEDATRGMGVAFLIAVKSHQDMDEGLSLQAIVRALAHHLRSHPHASDTAQGIRLWWLNQEHSVTSQQLQLALTWACQHRLVEAAVARDGRCRYRRIASDRQLDALLNSSSLD